MSTSTVPTASRSPGGDADFWSQPLATLLNQLGTNGEGLRTADANSRLAREGPNQLAQAARSAAVLQTLRRLVNPLSLILLIASGISIALGEVVDATIIILIVLLSAAVDVFQMRRSQAAAEQLRRRVETHAAVLRDGHWTDVPARLIVPGDRLRLSTGDIVPADARVMVVNTLYVDEAAFTGESLPVDKTPADIVTTADPARATNAVFMGTVVTGGSGEALVVRTGRNTTYSHLAERMQKVVPETAFDRGLRGFGLLITRTVAVLVVFVLLVNVAAGRNPFQSVLFAVALAVGLTPEFLPMILTVTQAQGALQMARSKVIVRRLSAMQNFGGLDVLCSDKTGTLTEGRMEVSRTVDAAGAPSEHVHRDAFINASAQSGLHSPFDEALVASMPGERVEFSKVGELPYDFERRRLSVLVDVDGERRLITKGAPEGVLAVCQYVGSHSGRLPLDTLGRATIDKLMNDLGAGGYRVLGVATRSLDSNTQPAPDLESDLVFEGLIAFSDPPRVDVADVVRALREDGIALKILTGDAEPVTHHVCDSIGLVNEPILTGEQLDALGDTQLQHTLETVNVFARVAPEQKLRIIHALQRQRRVVGYLGDGINDAPSLRAADVGISVSGAVDVAREAADVILVEKSLSVLHNGIIEGRKSFGNVIKYIMMGTSSNFGNVLSMAVAAIALPFLPMLPPQVLLNNALYDLSQITIPTDNVDATMLQKPHQWDMTFVRDFMLVFGPISSLYDFLTFFVLRDVFHADMQLFHTGWFIESLATQTLVIFVIRTVGNPLRSRPSRPLMATVLLVVFIGAILPWTPLAQPLGFTPPPVPFMVFVAGAVVTYLALVEAIKRIFYRYHPLITAHSGVSRPAAGIPLPPASTS
jgi:Mg2+-importing ATPase